MPDHVKNPERYTCYDLGESITIGGGDQGSSADGGRGEMERVSQSTFDASVGKPSHRTPIWPGSAAVKLFRTASQLRVAYVMLWSRLRCIASALLL